VQERLIGALIPDALGPRNQVARIPLAVLPALSRLDNLKPAALLVSTSRMDRSGRIRERILLRQLGWHPGTRLDIDTLHELIVIAATPAGHHTIDHRGAIKPPASLRRLCGIDHGPPLVLAATVSAAPRSRQRCAAAPRQAEKKTWPSDHREKCRRHLTRSWSPDRVTPHLKRCRGGDQ
jgi:hypothetical protein